MNILKTKNKLYFKKLLMIRQFIFIIVSILFISCENKKLRKIIEKSNIECLSPSDAILKFYDFNEKDFFNSIEQLLEEKNIVVDAADKHEIKNWVYNKVFSPHRGNSFVLEWNINDADICTFQNVTVSDTLENISEVSIQICNSIMNSDVSAGNFWVLDSKNYYIEIKFCFNSLKFRKRVGYYEIINNNDNLQRSLKTDLHKYNSVIDTHLRFLDKQNNTEIFGELIGKEGILYTDYRNW